MQTISLFEGCLFGKQQWQKFPKEGSCIVTLLALVHFDVCGPMLTIFHNVFDVFRHSLTIIIDNML